MPTITQPQQSPSPMPISRVRQLADRFSESSTSSVQSLGCHANAEHQQQPRQQQYRRRTPAASATPSALRVTPKYARNRRNRTSLLLPPAHKAVARPAKNTKSVSHDSLFSHGYNDEEQPDTAANSSSIGHDDESTRADKTDVQQFATLARRAPRPAFPPPQRPKSPNSDKSICDLTSQRTPQPPPVPKKPTHLLNRPKPATPPKPPRLILRTTETMQDKRKLDVHSPRFVLSSTSTMSPFDASMNESSVFPSPAPDSQRCYVVYDQEFSSLPASDQPDAGNNNNVDQMKSANDPEIDQEDEVAIAGDQMRIDGLIYQAAMDDPCEAEDDRMEFAVPIASQDCVASSSTCAEEAPPLPPRNPGESVDDCDLPKIEVLPPTAKKNPPALPPKTVRLVDGKPRERTPPPLPTCPPPSMLQIESDDESNVYEDIDQNWMNESLMLAKELAVVQAASAKQRDQPQRAQSAASWQTTTETTSDEESDVGDSVDAIDRMQSDNSTTLMTQSQTTVTSSTTTLRHHSNRNSVEITPSGLARADPSFPTVPVRPPRPRRRERVAKASRKKLFRPIAQPSLDGLLRIKSDIQLNLAKQVGNIKLKVTSVAATSSEHLNQLQLRLPHPTGGGGAAARARRKKKSQSAMICNDPLAITNVDGASCETNAMATSMMVTSVQFPLGESDMAATSSGTALEYDWSDLDEWSDEHVDDEDEDEEEGDEQSVLHSPEPTVDDCQHHNQQTHDLNVSCTSHSSGVLPDVVTSSTERIRADRADVDSAMSDSCCYNTVRSNAMSPIDVPDVDGGVGTVPVDPTMSRPGSSSATTGVSSDDLHRLSQQTYHGRFVDNAPLYQHLLGEDAPKLTEKLLRMESMSSTDSGARLEQSAASSSASSRRTSSLRERFTCVSQLGSQRMLWCELPEVISSGLLERLSPVEKKLQEAQFETITSEASYLRSLNVLITHFMAAAELSGNTAMSSAIDKRDRRHLFSNILAVRDCSEALLSDLEVLLDHSVILDDVCGVLIKHFETEFEVYVKYCTNQLYQDRTLKRLKATSPAFLLATQQLEAAKQCEGLDMRSFLMLPTQRVTRYPLLVMAILDRTDVDSHLRQDAKRALTLANQIVRRCNEGARRMERMEQLVDIEQRLVYKAADMKRVPLVCSSRHLVKEGALFEVVRQDGLIRRKSSLTLATLKPHSNPSRLRHVRLLLFNDMLLIAKPKSNGSLVVRDYCSRAFVEVAPLEVGCSQVPTVAMVSCLPATHSPHLFGCTVMCGSRGKQTELILSAETESDRQRWLSALRPPVADNPDERVYAPWDCPQVRAVHEYVAQQKDELALVVGDVVDVSRKMTDGWFEGKRLSDGAVGWFPSSYVVELLNDHVRARNYRQRLKLIQAAQSLQFERQQQQQHKKCKQQRSISTGQFVPLGGDHKDVGRLRAVSSGDKVRDNGKSREERLVHRLRRLSNPMSMFNAKVSVVAVDSEHIEHT